MRKTDRPAVLWMCNFRQHIAEHFDDLEDHVLIENINII